MNFSPTFAAPAPVRRFAVHGLAIELDCAVDGLVREVDRLFEDFEVAAWPEGFVPVSGSIRPYDVDAVTKALSPAARPVPCAGNQLVELYEDGERFWLVDDRWGLAEVNLLRGTFRAWVLPRARIDAVRCAELAILWPLAQLLRPKGLHLVPAAAAVRDGRGMLVISPLSLGPELGALIRSGYRIIAQRWCAIREEEGRVALLSLPGLVERPAPPRAAGSTAPAQVDATWADLMGEHLGAWQHYAFCETIVVVEPGRRPAAYLKELTRADGVNAVRGAWPIVELHPHRRQGQLATRLAHTSACYEAALSRDPRDFVSLIAALPLSPVRIAPPTTPRPAVTIHAKAPDRAMRIAI